MPTKHIVKRRRWTLSLLAAGLIALFAAVAPPPAFTAEAKFVVPIVIGGITYQGEGVVAEDGSIVVTVRIVYRQAVPGPKPPPEPEPKPPVPAPTKISVIYVVHESGDGTPAFTAIRNAAGWKQECDKLGIKWLVVDVDTARPKLPQAVKLAVAKGLPAIVLLDAQGLGIAEACPKTPDAMLERVRKAGKP